MYCGREWQHGRSVGRRLGTNQRWPLLLLQLRIPVVLKLGGDALSFVSWRKLPNVVHLQRRPTDIGLSASKDSDSLACANANLDYTVLVVTEYIQGDSCDWRSISGITRNCRCYIAPHSSTKDHPNELKAYSHKSWCPEILN